MGISIVLRNERGDDIHRLAAPYVHPAASWVASAYPLLSGIDPDGNTIFNARQMQQMLPEVEGLLGIDLGNEERESVAGVASLCLEGQRPPHRYLWFIGD
jgi:hypothetical protein